MRVQDHPCLGYVKSCLKLVKTVEIVNKQSLLSLTGLQQDHQTCKSLSEDEYALHNANSFNHTNHAATEAAEHPSSHPTGETTKC